MTHGKYRHALLYDPSITKRTCNDNAVDKNTEGDTNIQNYGHRTQIRRTTENVLTVSEPLPSGCDIIKSNKDNLMQYKYERFCKRFSLRLDHNATLHVTADKRPTVTRQSTTFDLTTYWKLLQGIIATRTQIQGVRSNDQITEWPQFNKGATIIQVHTTKQRKEPECVRNTIHTINASQCHHRCRNDLHWQLCNMNMYSSNWETKTQIWSNSNTTKAQIEIQSSTA